MKRTKKLFAVLLAVAMTMALSITAFAAETVTITVEEPSDTNATPETYTAYRLLDATKTAELAATSPIEGGASGITYYTTGTNAALLGSYFIFENGKIGDDTTTYSIVKSSTITANDQTAAAALLAIAKANSFPSADVTPNTATSLPIGYYVIESSLGSQLIMLTTDQTINQKNVYPSFIKAFTYDNDKNAAIGETIEYTITVTVPATVDKDITIVDTLNAALINPDVTAANAVDNVTAAVNGQVITFTISKDAAPASGTATVTIPYSATLGTAAVSGGAYENSAVLSYSNFTTPPQSVVTNTNKLSVSKINGDTNAALSGATLQLQDASGNALNLVATATGYRLAMTGDENTVSQFVSGDTAIVIEGLDSDLAYQIVELEAPAGFNALTAPVPVAANANNDREATVENFTGTVLPSTGGMGTKVFYGVGAVLVVGAAVILVSKKRAGSN